MCLRVRKKSLKKAIKEGDLIQSTIFDRFIRVIVTVVIVVIFIVIVIVLVVVVVVITVVVVVVDWQNMVKCPKNLIGFE